jgi:hypothetical protein
MTDKFLTERNIFASKLGIPDLFDYIDHFSLFAGTHTLGNKIFTYEILKKTAGIPGDVAEFGCWKGSNLMFLAKILTLLEPNSPKKVIGFDNFCGLPKPSKEDGPYALSQIGKYKGDLETLRLAINLFDLDNKISLIAGDALKTIPKYKKDNSHSVFSFCYLDFDLYEPTKVALDLIEDSLSVGGVIVFDEALTAEWPGETLAMKEYLMHSKRKFRMITNTLSRQPTLALIRIE